MSMSESDYSQSLAEDGHMTLGHTSDIPMPDRFTAPDNGRVVPQQMGALEADEEDNELFHGNAFNDADEDSAEPE